MRRDESFNLPDPDNLESMAMTFAMASDTEDYGYPLTPSMLQREQQKDEKFMQRVNKNPQKYST